jgi:hypothetical protein
MSVPDLRAIAELISVLIGSFRCEIPLPMMRNNLWTLFGYQLCKSYRYRNMTLAHKSWECVRTFEDYSLLSQCFASNRGLRTECFRRY